MVGNFKYKLSHLHAYQQVMLVHSAVYVILLLLSVFSEGFSSERIVDYAGWSGEWSNITSHPWTLISHMLVHISFAHFFLNLLVLYVIGKELEQIAGRKKWWSTYLFSTFGGILVYSISAEFLNFEDHFLVGNSAANMGLVFALVGIDYNKRINFWGVVILEMKWVALFFIVLDLIGIRQGWNAGGSWAHIGGAVVGWLLWRRRSSGRNFPMSVHRRPKTDDEFNAERVDKEKQLNAILDKISRSGYESLSRSEKEFLKRQSQG